MTLSESLGLQNLTRSGRRQLPQTNRRLGVALGIILFVSSGWPCLYNRSLTKGHGGHLLVTFEHPDTNAIRRWCTLQRLKRYRVMFKMHNRQTIGILDGSFDPIHHNHFSTIKQALLTCDALYVLLAHNLLTARLPPFISERITFIQPLNGGCQYISIIGIPALSSSFIIRLW